MKITEEMISIKAYELWEANGKPMGAAEENWFTAKSMLLNVAKTTTSGSNKLPPNGLRQLSTP